MTYSPGAINDLLSTKLEMPTSGNIIVRRDRLYDRLRNTGDSRITLVTAPTGYGKTTLLFEWLSSIPKNRQHTAWITLDTFDNSAQQFWSYICAAIKKTYPRFNFNTKNTLPYEHDQQAFKELIPLINAIALIPFRLNLVLDDFQSIDNEFTQQSLLYLMEHQPKNLHLIISSRVLPPFSLSRMRIQKRLVELSARELSFTFQEVNTYLTKVVRLNITPEQIKALHKATEGWIAGLQLAALSLQSQHNFKYPGSQFLDSNEEIFTYLTEEIFNHQEPDVQKFLMKTSVLPDLYAPLCDAVLKRQDSQELLQKIERANLFLVALDTQKRWFRYHPLFANAMASHLKQSQPEIIPEIHRTACNWLWKNGYANKAVSHALAVGDLDTAAEMVDNCALQAIIRFDMNSLIHWTNRFSLDLMAKYPRLGIYRALACFQLSILDQVEPELQRVEHALKSRFDGQPFDNDHTSILWEIASMRAVMECTWGDIDNGIQRILELQQNQPEKDQYISGWLDHSLAEIYSAIGDLQSAISRFEQGRQFAASHGMAVGFFVSTTALVHLYKRQGRLCEAERHMQTGLDFAREEQLNYWLMNLMYSYRWEINLERAAGEPDDDRIREILGFFHEGEDDLFSYQYRITLGLSLARCLLQVHNIEQAEMYAGMVLQQLRKEHEASIDSMNSTILLSELIDIMVRVWTAKGIIKTKDISFIKEFPFRRSSPLLEISIQTALARMYLSKGDFQKALQTIKNIEPGIRQSGMGERLIEILLLQAIIYYETEQKQQAFEQLSQALELAEPEGYLRIFINEGEAAEALFRQYPAARRQVKKNTNHLKRQAYVQRILQEFAAARKFHSHVAQTQDVKQPVISTIQEQLTEREQDVYHLLVSGKSTKEIAAALMISVNTAKTHVWNIHRKLT